MTNLDIYIKISNKETYLLELMTNMKAMKIKVNQNKNLKTMMKNNNNKKSNSPNLNKLR